MYYVKTNYIPKCNQLDVMVHSITLLIPSFVIPLHLTRRREALVYIVCKWKGYYFVTIVRKIIGFA